MTYKVKQWCFCEINFLAKPNILNFLSRTSHHHTCRDEATTMAVSSPKHHSEFAFLSIKRSHRGSELQLLLSPLQRVEQFIKRVTM